MRDAQDILCVITRAKTAVSQFWMSCLPTSLAQCWERCEANFMGSLVSVDFWPSKLFEDNCYCQTACSSITPDDHGPDEPVQMALLQSAIPASSGLTCTPSPGYTPSFDFETDATGSCPQGWTCTGSAAVQSLGSLDSGCPVSSGHNGAHVLSVGCDQTKGLATSNAFVLPADVMSLRFVRSGGADSPSGLYVKLADSFQVIALSRDGANTDDMFEVELPLSAYAGKSVYIEVMDLQESSWGKVAIGNIRSRSASYPFRTQSPR